MARPIDSDHSEEWVDKIHDHVGEEDATDY